MLECPTFSSMFKIAACVIEYVGRTGCPSPAVSSIPVVPSRNSTQLYPRCAMARMPCKMFRINYRSHNHTVTQHAELSRT